CTNNEWVFFFIESNTNEVDHLKTVCKKWLRQT
ncbi:MAG: hypothetical protein ACI9RI_001418, partial [Oceanospirillaceae bacterium]